MQKLTTECTETTELYWIKFCLRDLCVLSG